MPSTGRRGLATPATQALAAARVTFRQVSYVHDASTDSYGEEAARELGLEPRRVFKTLVTQADGIPAIAVVPVADRVDLKALASALGAKKASLVEPATAQRLTGYVVGGISPLGQRTQLRTVIDASATTHDTVFVSAGRRGLEVELTPDDLRQATAAIFAPIAR